MNFIIWLDLVKLVVKNVMTLMADVKVGMMCNSLFKSIGTAFATIALMSCYAYGQDHAGITVSDPIDSQISTQIHPSLVNSTPDVLSESRHTVSCEAGELSLAVVERWRGSEKLETSLSLHFNGEKLKLKLPPHLMMKAQNVRNMGVEFFCDVGEVDLVLSGVEYFPTKGTSNTISEFGDFTFVVASKNIRLGPGI